MLAANLLRLAVGLAFWPLQIAAFELGAEKPVDFKIRSCSLQPPTSEDTMLYFSDGLKFCSSLRTTKSVVSLARDRLRTTFLQPMASGAMGFVVTQSFKVYITIHEIASPWRCSIEYLGYGGEYRITPDLGFYPTCQKPISNYVSQLAASSTPPVWNVTNSHCPIQSLPLKYRDYLSCDLVKHRWYELQFKSSIRYEVVRKRHYHQAWSNYSTTFLFKPDNFVERNGSQLDWLQKLVNLEAKQKNCEKARYLIKVDEAFPLPLTVFLDYRIKEGGYIKFLKHLGNGTLDNWFSGAFSLEKSDRTHELCVQFVWTGSVNRYRLCRTFLQPNECRFGTNGGAHHVCSLSSSYSSCCPSGRRKKE
ncbi:hypothetical protein M3Y99_00790600 [Aphelenchoides fujianensis]|nr:hypothetical protein M3Y99_00790600 [Aphelenchoides fujianensis]